MSRVLVITDDLDFYTLLEYVLAAEGFLASRIVKQGDSPVDEHTSHAIIVLDANENTLDIYRSLRPTVTIALARSAERPPEGVTACLTRPFDLSHFLDVLQKVAGIDGEQRRPSRLRVDDRDRTVTWRDHTVRLSPIEFRLFADLYRHSGKIRLRADLLAAGWSPRVTVPGRRIDVHVCRLRRALAPLGETLIETIRSGGYKFLAPPDNS